jgi:hypothetical protein
MAGADGPRTIWPYVYDDNGLPPAAKTSTTLPTWLPPAPAKHPTVAIACDGGAAQSSPGGTAAKK